MLVDYFTLPGTASNGLDYVTSTGTITFGPGETNKTFTVTIIDDKLQEGNDFVIGYPVPARAGSGGSSG